ncbi:APC family permease [Brevibacterium sp. RIT 803]|uniref:APC family permease n=1 Tax=Brevibacterium sp. RIT 803 TaxID=2810210 RepID=UPI00195210EB|nr:APC family permease [Brevibacterium sp. RIT 803]MBM6588477.1 APC family permease [Brevibacterium sp. RIT 803]
MTVPTAEKTDSPGLKKALGVFDSYALGFGAMIGFGWVVLTSDWISGGGTLGAVIAMIIGGLIMAVVGLIYAELTAAMPKVGGEHHYLLRGMGARWSFLGSWGITGGYITIVAFEAVALPRTVEYIVPNLDHIRLWEIFGSEVHLTWALVGSVAAIVITWINIVGVRSAGIVQTFVVVFLVIVGLLMVFGASTNGTVENMQPFFTDTSGLFTVLIVVPFLFVGFDVIPQASEELRMSPRRIGILIVTSVLIATAWYVMTILTTSSAMPIDVLLSSDLATADAMGTLYNSGIMANVLIAGGIAGILTSWIALLLGASRLLLAMGQSGMLPKWFGKIHPKYGTPVNALMFIGALSFIAPFFGEGMLGWLVDSGSPSIVITYLLVSVVFVKLRVKEPTMDRPFLAGGRKGGIPLGVLAIVLCAGLVALYIPGMPASISPMAYVLFCCWWILGLFFVVRIPRGIRAGTDAEHRLLKAIALKEDGRK